MDEKTRKLRDILKKAKAEYSQDNIVLVVPHFLSKSFKTYCSMRGDLLLIKRYLERLAFEDDDLISSSLTYSLIALYGKCFTDATSSKSSKLEQEKLFDGESEYLETHAYLMCLRHDFIAHRGETQDEVEAAFITLPKGKGDSGIRFHSQKLNSFSKAKQKKINDLLDFVINIVEKKIQKCGQKVFTDYIKIVTPKQMSFMSINNLPEDEE